MTLAAGGLLGALFFLWIAGTRIITPTEYAWVMQLDWRIHFLGWHFFRHEPWQWPPGRIEGYFHAPDGTTIGFTDSIPLAAFALKPLSGVLPDVFQYLGLWLLMCFVLQGVFGVLLARLWTPRPHLQLLAAALFVLMPSLLMRVGHPSLCAHFLLLWALWLYFGPSSGVLPQAGLGLVAGLVHPYLAVMVLALLAALAIRARALRGIAAATAATLTGWWASGLLGGGSAGELAAEGLGNYSMNLLAPVTATGWSRFLPPLPLATPGQAYEGFQYLGAGALLLMLIAVALHVRRLHDAVRRTWPLLAICGVLAVYALSPRVTAGSAVVFDYSSERLDQYAVFRATGRFFWPLAYVALLAAIAAIVTRFRPAPAAGVLAAVVVLQLVDLSPAHAERRAMSRSEAFHAHRLPLTSPEWAARLPHYQHMVLFNPPQCGDAPAPFEWPAFLAGRYGLTINAGEVARPDAAKVRRYCRELQEQMRAGDVRHDTIYLVHPRFVGPLRAAARHPMVCQTIDAIPVCMTEHSLAGAPR